MLWLILTLVLALGAVLMARPFLKGYRRSVAGRAQDVALYKEQLRELEGEVARGTVSEAEAEDTRRDIERRAFAAVKKSGGGEMAGSLDKVRIIGIAVTMGWLVMGSVGLYVWIGRPEFGTSVPVDGRIAMQAPRAQLPMSTPVTPAPQSTARQPGDVNTMIANLAARLQDNPDDLAGWRMLGWSYFNTDNPEGAVTAYARAVELAPADAEGLALYGEALTRVAGGRVTLEAQEIFARALRFAPENPRALFFKGMALRQSGQTDAAIETWAEALRLSPSNAPWLPGLRQQMQELGGNLGAADLTPPAPRAPGNPTQDDIAAAQEMSTEDRQDMILGMVESLAARLEDNPNNPEGWARLIRSYAVIGEGARAADALGKARSLYAENPGMLAQLSAMAAELGLQ